MITTKRVTCPSCKTSYPEGSLYYDKKDRPRTKEARTYTVVCSNCLHQFDVRLQASMWSAIIHFFKRW